MESTNNPSNESTNINTNKDVPVSETQQNLPSTTTSGTGISFSGVLNNNIASPSVFTTTTSTSTLASTSTDSVSSHLNTTSPISPTATTKAMSKSSPLPGSPNPETSSKDSSFDAFLTPPPASTLLIRRTRTSSTGPSTYVVQSLPAYGSTKLVKQPGSEAMDIGFDGSPNSPITSDGETHRKGKPRMGSKDGISSPSSSSPRIKTRGGRTKPNIDPITGKRRYRRKNKLTFTTHKKASQAVNPDQSEFLLAETAPPPLLSLTWRPDDDLRLLVNVLQTRDFKQVHLGVRFSKRYTLDEIKKRWNTLLHNNSISKTSSIAILELHPKVTTKIFASALLSEGESKLLQQIKSTSNPTEKTFEELLQEHPLTFFKCRTPKFLHRSWSHLKNFHLLDDQNVKDYFESDMDSFSDFENTITDEDIRNLHIDPAFMQEFLQNERRNKKKIRILEEEIARWQELSDLVWEGQIVKTPEFDDKTYAFIRGRNVRFAMAAKEITLGRRTKNNWVDADLSEEGSDTRVSRRQATIKMRTLGDFVLLNQGRHPMYVDGQAIFPGETTTLQDQSVITVSDLNFVFIVNDKLLTDLRKKIIEEESNAEHVDVENIETVDSDSDTDSRRSTPCPSPTKFRSIQQQQLPNVNGPQIVPPSTSSASLISPLAPPTQQKSSAYFVDSNSKVFNSTSVRSVSTTSPTDAYFQSSWTGNNATQDSSSSSTCTSPPPKKTYTLKKKKMGGV